MSKEYLDKAGLNSLWAKIKSKFATPSYIFSRGENLVTNGTCLLGDNTNFSGFTFDGKDTYYAGGSFKKTSGSTIATNDEPIPVDVSSEYEFSYYIKSDNASARYYDLLNSYDIDNNMIMAYNVMWQPGSTTTLARELKNGDTVVYLTTVAGFNKSLAQTYQRGLIFWNWKNSKGYEYGTETYSRNVYQDLWANSSSFNDSTNSITLKSPWSKGTFAAGTPVSQCSDGGNYIYLNANYTLQAGTWTKKTGILKGVGRNNAGGKFREGTAFIKIGWLLNREVSSCSTWISTISFTQCASRSFVNSLDSKYLGKTAKAASASSADSVAWTGVSGRPTKLSDFTNDRGYITGYTETDPTVPSWAKAASKPTYTASEVGASPTGHKHSASDITSGLAAVSTSGSYNDLVDKPALFSGSWNDLADKPSIPEGSVVDAAFSDTSTNAVQNKVVKAALDAKSDSGHNHDGVYLKSFTETDPTVPAWAKEASKPAYTAAEVGASPTGHKHVKADITDFPAIPTTTSSVTQNSTAALTSGGAYTALAGKSDTDHNHSGVYAAADHNHSGTQTSASLQNLGVGTEDLGDDMYFVSTGASSTTTWFRRKASTVWNYIKGKMNKWTAFNATTTGATHTTTYYQNNSSYNDAVKLVHLNVWVNITYKSAQAAGVVFCVGSVPDAYKPAKRTVLTAGYTGSVSTTGSAYTAVWRAFINTDGKIYAARSTAAASGDTVSYIDICGTYPV